MNFEFVYTKYYDTGMSTQKRYIYCVGEIESIIVENLFEKIDRILKNKYVETIGTISVSKNKIILSYDDFEIKIKPLNSIFNFEEHITEIYNKFEFIRYGGIQYN